MDDSYWTKRFAGSKLTRRKALISASSATMAAFLAACSSDEPSTAPDSTAEGGAPQQGGRFTTITGDVPNNNPVTNYSGGHSLAGNHVYDRLLTSTTTGQGYRLEAAEKIEVVDSRQIVFTLRAGMKYQNFAPVNGRDVKASDVVASQGYVLGVANAYDKAFQRDVIDSVTAPDDRTVVMKLKQPDAYMFSGSKLGLQTSQCIIPPELYDNLDQGQSIGSGPYEVVEERTGRQYIYKRFAGWRGAADRLPYVDERQVLILIDQVAIETAMRAGQVLYWNTAPLGRVDSIASESSGRIKTISVQGLGFWGVHMNMENGLPWQKDERVRQAMYRAINRQQILDLAFASKGVLPSALLQVGLKDYQLDAKDTAQYWKNDIAEGKQLLAAANFDTNQEYEMITRAAGLNTPTTEVVAQQLSSIGMKFRVLQIPQAEWLPIRMARGEYQVNVGSSPGGDSPYMTIRYLHSDQKTQFTHFGLKDAGLDALIEKSEITVDKEENIKLVKQIQMEGMRKYGSVISLVTQDVISLLDSRVQNFVLPPSTSNVDAGYQETMWIKQA